MAKYLWKRLLISIVVFFGITILVYGLSNLAPGSPVDMYISPEMTAEDLAALRESMGLNQPVYVQYMKWLGQLFQGNMGYSYRTKEAVLPMITERLGPTLLITVTSVVLALCIAIPLGTLAAYKPYSAWDYLSSGLSLTGVAIPSFFAAVVLIYIFCVKLGVLPNSGMYDSASSPNLPSLLRHMILPVAVLTFQQVGNFIRQTRNSMLEVFEEDYVTMARAKGLNERQVVFGHVMRNALIPIVTAVGMSVPFLIGGAVLVEKIFSWPGLGSLMVQSINYKDYPTIMGITVFISITVLMCNILVDIIYGILDPRIRYR